MDFTLDKKHEMARSLFRDFAQNEVKPLAQEIDEEERFPRETFDKLAKYGFMGITAPREYGGQGCDELTYVLCLEEIAKVCGCSFCSYFSVHRPDHDLRYRGAEEEIYSEARKR